MRWHIYFVHDGKVVARVLKEQLAEVQVAQSRRIHSLFWERESEAEDAGVEVDHLGPVSLVLHSHLCNLGALISTKIMCHYLLDPNCLFLLVVLALHSFIGFVSVLLVQNMIIHWVQLFIIINHIVNLIVLLRNADLDLWRLFLQAVFFIGIEASSQRPLLQLRLEFEVTDVGVLPYNGSDPVGP